MARSSATTNAHPTVNKLSLCPYRPNRYQTNGDVGVGKPLFVIDGFVWYRCAMSLRSLGGDIKGTFLKLTMQNSKWSTCSEIALSWMLHNLTKEKSTLLQVMAWCRQATSHYLNQCWPRSMSPYGVTRPRPVEEIASVIAHFSPVPELIHMAVHIYIYICIYMSRHNTMNTNTKWVLALFSIYLRIFYKLENDAYKN